MPYSTRKVANRNCYRVYNTKSKRVFAKCTSMKKAKKQLQLLRAVQNNKNFVPNSKNRTRKMSRK